MLAPQRRRLRASLAGGLGRSLASGCGWALVLLLLLGLLPVVPGFYHFIQARPGQRLADPLLALLPVHDVSALTFALIYGGIAATLVLSAAAAAAAAAGAVGLLFPAVAAHGHAVAAAAGATHRPGCRCTTR